MCRSELRESFVISPAMAGFGDALAQVLDSTGNRTTWSQIIAAHTNPANAVDFDLSDALKFEYHRYHPQMLDWVQKRL